MRQERFNMPQPATREPPKELLTPCEVARRLAISIRTLYKLARRGIVPPPLRLTPKIARWRASDIQRYLEQITQYEQSRRPSA